MFNFKWTTDTGAADIPPITLPPAQPGYAFHQVFNGLARKLPHDPSAVLPCRRFETQVGSNFSPPIYVFDINFHYLL